jgi:hypothetical protein
MGNLAEQVRSGQINDLVAPTVHHGLHHIEAEACHLHIEAEACHLREIGFRETGKLSGVSCSSEQWWNGLKEPRDRQSRDLWLLSKPLP